MSDNNDGSPTIKWVNVSSEEARALAPQSEYFNDARRQSERVTDAVDKALARPDWSRAVPAGEDPKSYINGMVRKYDGGNFVTPAQESSQATQVAFAPSTLVIRSPAGATRTPNAAQPGDLLEINVNGQKVTLRCDEAVRQGLLKQDRDGGYKPLSSDDREDARQQLQREQQDQQALAKAEMPALRESGDEPDEYTQRAIDDVATLVSGDAVGALVQDYASNGTLSAANVARVGQAAGLSADQTESLSIAVVRGLQRQAATAVASSGVAREEAQDVYDWAAVHYPVEHRNAVVALAMQSDAKGLKALATKYAAWKRQQQG